MFCPSCTYHSSLYTPTLAASTTTQYSICLCLQAAPCLPEAPCPATSLEPRTAIPRPPGQHTVRPVSRPNRLHPDCLSNEDLSRLWLIWHCLYKQATVSCLLPFCTFWYTHLQALPASQLPVAIHITRLMQRCHSGQLTTLLFTKILQFTTLHCSKILVATHGMLFLSETVFHIFWVNLGNFGCF